MKNKYKFFNIYESPEKPTDTGVYIGKTPLYEQALSACERAKEAGKSYFIKGVLEDDTEVIIL